MKIYYVRHGETNWNLEKKMQGGEVENLLNDTGIKQAEKTKKELETKKYDIIICSPMERAKQTAQIINNGKNIPMIIDERLRERKLGELNGNQVTAECEEKIWRYDLNTEIKYGENLQQFEKRILDFLKDIKEKYKDNTLLIVAHGGIAKIIKAYLDGNKKQNDLSNYKMENCEILEIEI